MCFIATLLQLYLLAIIGRVIMSWIPVSPDSLWARIARFLYTVTEPVLGPLRRAIPPIGGPNMAFDLSPLIVLIVIELLIPRLCARGGLLPFL